jgi:hypothetical protein
MRRHLFVAEGNVFDPDLVAGVDEGVVGMSTLPEDLRDAFLLQALRDKCSSVQLEFSFATSDANAADN